MRERQGGQGRHPGGDGGRAELMPSTVVLRVRTGCTPVQEGGEQSLPRGLGKWGKCPGTTRKQDSVESGAKLCGTGTG